MTKNPIRHLAERIRETPSHQRDALISRFIDEFCEEYERQTPGCSGPEIVGRMWQFAHLLGSEVQTIAYQQILSGPVAGHC